MRFGSSQTFRAQLDTVFSRLDFSKVIILDLQLHYFNNGSVNQRMSHKLWKMYSTITSVIFRMVACMVESYRARTSVP